MTSELLLHFVRRDWTLRYRGTATGVLWAMASPVALLAIYSYVFVVVFKARVPEADTAGFVPYLALAFWPWMAFAESVSRSIGVIGENESLIRKSPVPHQLLVYASVLSNFSLHFIGYIVVLAILALTGTELYWAYLPLLLPILAMVLLFTLAISLIVATLQVFLRDVQHAMVAILTLWFFATPVLYSPTLIPEVARPYLMLNPMAYYVTRLRDVLLHGQWQPAWGDAIALLGSLALFAFALWLFKRCSGRFEDFL
jgi:ABC-type polysaccharide/polyol phosphate export permease